MTGLSGSLNNLPKVVSISKLQKWDLQKKKPLEWEMTATVNREIEHMGFIVQGVQGSCH